MIIFVTFLCFFASACTAQPNKLQIVEINPQNVVTVPPNCPVGQVWWNGACREIWSITDDAAPANVITVPPNCPPGQQYINGQCRDVWIKSLLAKLRGDIQPEVSESSPKNTITAPPNCPPGQQWVNGACRDVWRSGTKNVITAPTNCPSGQEFIGGQCREVWRRLQIFNNLNIGAQGEANRNVISVPSQCPSGYKPDALGNCRPIFYD